MADRRPSPRQQLAAVAALASISAIVGVICLAAAASERSPSSADAFRVVGALNLALVVAYLLMIAATVRRSTMGRPLVLVATSIVAGVAVVWVVAVFLVSESLLLWVAFPMAFTVGLALRGAWYETQARFIASSPRS